MRTSDRAGMRTSDRAGMRTSDRAGMRTSDRAVGPPRELAPVNVASPRGRLRRLARTGGGTSGNEQLTALTGLVLIVLLAVIGVTILRIRQLIWPHLFVGLLLIGPVVLKMGSTGYRFVRYYTGDPVYRRKGPPELPLRLIAPLVVLCTVIVFVSGVVLLFEGPARRAQWLLIHKVSFIVWIVFTALHVLGHLPGFGVSLRAGATGAASAVGAVSGRGGRSLALASALVGGLVIALVLIPHFGAWSAHSAIFGHDH